MKVIAIVAASLNNVIGVNGQLPWKAPSDLARFQKETMGHNVLMGRKTWESLPRSNVPKSNVPGVKLPGRNCHVVTRNQNMLKKSAADYGCNGLWASLFVAVERLTANAGKQLFIIGGSEIFEEALELALIDEVWLTRIQTIVYPQVGDALAYFPQVRIQDWPKVCSRLPTGCNEVAQVLERYENPNRIKKEEPEMIDADKDIKAKARMQRLLSMVVDAYNFNGTICYDLASLCANELELEITERQPQTGETESPSPLAAEVAAAVGEHLKTALKVSGVMKIENLTINIS